MKKKVLSLVTVGLALLLLTMIFVGTLSVQATSNHKKEDFLKFTVSGTSNWQVDLGAVPWIVVSPTISTKNVDESASAYVITIGDPTVGEKTYSLGTDFTYKGHVLRTMDSSYTPPYSTMRFDYTYDFSAVKGGLKGEINLVAMFVFGSAAGKTFIWSVSGTHDFKGVHIEATTTTPAPAPYMFAHIGIVSGWPDEREKHD
jgi:hypothetical protein